MKKSATVPVAVVLGCVVVAAGFLLSSRVGWSATPSAVQQYCTDSGDSNNVVPVDDLVRRAGAEGWDLVGVYRPAASLGNVDYVCFRRQGSAGVPVLPPRRGR
jgi:hypothetical protein